jgi:excisionase family DNA binding protein
MNRHELATAEWWTPAEAAFMLGVNKSTIARWTAQGLPHEVGVLPTRKKGRKRVRFRRYDLFRWLDERGSRTPMGNQPQEES